MSFIDKMNKSKKKMNRIRYSFNFTVVPIFLLVGIVVLSLYLFLILKYNDYKLLFKILCSIKIVGIIIFLIFYNKKVNRIELQEELTKHTFDYSNLELKKYYQLNLVDVNGTQEYITFMDGKLHMFGQTYNYDDLYFYFVSNNEYKLVNLDMKIYFSNPKDINASYMLLTLDNEMFMILDQFNIKIENEKEFNYLRNNKEDAFKQILKYSKIKYIEGRRI